MTTFATWTGRAVLAVALASQSAAAMADVLIIRSAGPSASRYPVGQRLPDSADLALRPGDSVTVLRRGGTRIFRGPGSFSVSSPAVLRRPDPRNVRITTGAVRGGSDQNAPSPLTSEWQYDASISGRACVRARAPLVLWRQRFDAPLKLTLTTAAGGTATVDWAAGQQTISLTPAQLRDVSRIDHQVPGASRPTQINLAQIQVQPDNREAVVAALIEAQCRSQVDTFIALHQEYAD